MESPCPPKTMASTSTSEQPSSSDTNVRKRAESSTPAMPIILFFGSLLVCFAMYTIASSGFDTTIMMGSWECSMIFSVTDCTILALVARRSSRLIPGLRGKPAVMTTTSEFAVSL